MSTSTPNPTLADRLKGVQAGLRPELEVSRHLFRRVPSYVVRNPITFQTHSFSAADYQILVALDNTKSLGEIFNRLVQEKKIEAQQEEAFYTFLLNLHQLGFLNLPITDGKALYERFQKRQARKRQAKLTGFLFWRIPLINPDTLLDRTVRYAAPLFTRFAFLAWLGLMAICMGILWTRWDAFLEPIQTILVTKNLVGLWILLIGLKIIHEFGHAYACKLFGGKVPEMGAFLVCFTPCAYVDASAAWGFSSKKHRIIVSLAGMYVELLVAAIALLIWNATGPSMVNSLAHQTVTLASLITVGFNINPLMKYDGYYVLSDLAEIPNLRQRSVVEVQAVCKRWLLGLSSTTQPISQGGRFLLLAYGVGASIWKVTLVFAICAGIALKIYILGILMALFYGGMTIWSTAAKFVGYLFISPETAPVRVRAIVLGLLVMVLLPAAVAWVPLSKPIDAYGVIATADERSVYAQTSGFLQHCELVAGLSVAANAPLYTLKNDQTSAKVVQVSAQLEVLRLQAESQFQADLTASTATLKKAEQVHQELLQAEKEVEHLVVKAPIAGKVVDRTTTRRSGQFLNRGERVATILSGAWIVRTLITAEDFADMKPRVGAKVHVRLLGDTAMVHQGTIHQVATTGSELIATPRLTQIGGGTIAVSPDTMMASEPFFEITIELDNPPEESLHHGMTALVGFSGKSQTIGQRLYRSVLRFVNKLRT